MRRLARLLLVAMLAISVTGAASFAAAMTVPVASHHCERTSNPCHEPSFRKCCCADGAHGLPVPAPPTQRTSLSSTQHHASAYLLVDYWVVDPVHAAAFHARSTHRVRPPGSLSILHASLLL